MAWMMDQLSGDEHRSSESYDQSKWIEFEDNYIRGQQSENLDWYKENSQPIREWGLGGIFDSFTFPQCLAGHTIRTPGRYHKMDPVTGSFMRNRLLENTNEYIHASVRARKEFHGRGLEDSDKEGTVWTFVTRLIRKMMGQDQKLYDPPALHGWRLRDVHGYHDPSSVNGSKSDQKGVSGMTDSRRPWWEWEGRDDHVAALKQLPEDRLGTYDLQLLERFPDEAEDIKASNAGDSSILGLERLRERQKKRSVTAPR